jgi:hypothetical protein
MAFTKILTIYQVYYTQIHSSSILLLWFPNALVVEPYFNKISPRSTNTKDISKMSFVEVWLESCALLHIPQLCLVALVCFPHRVENTLKTKVTRNTTVLSVILWLGKTSEGFRGVEPDN